jgi:hypothetical protein
VADGYAVSFMKRTTNAGTPSNKARYTYRNTMGARAPVSVPLNGPSNSDTGYTSTPCGKWQKDRNRAIAMIRLMLKRLVREHKLYKTLLGISAARSSSCFSLW